MYSNQSAGKDRALCASGAFRPVPKSAIAMGAILLVIGQPRIGFSDCLRFIAKRLQGRDIKEGAETSSQRIHENSPLGNPSVVAKCVSVRGREREAGWAGAPVD